MKNILVLLIFMCSLSACTDLDVNPNSQLTDAVIYKDKKEFLFGLSGAYSTLGVWSEVVYKAGSSTDEMIFPARGADWKGDLQPMQDHSWSPVNGELNGLYTGVSKTIAVCNSFIDAIDNSSFKDDAEVIGIRSEARFIRVFGYFLMMDMFGNVPLVTTSAYDAQNPPRQNTRAELFQYVEDELKELSEKALPKTNAYGRVDKYAAKTLLAKLYLNAEVYLGDGKARWQEVAALTQEIMTEGSYKLEDNFKNVFAWNNDQYKENIFVVVCDSRYSAAENISYLFSLSDLTTKYGDFAWGWGGAAALPGFYKLYEATDVRREAFLAGPQVNAKGEPIIDVDDAGVSRQLTYAVDFVSKDPVYNADHWDGARGVKYLMEGIGGDMFQRGLNNDMPILRYADVLLMRAEALFRQNPSNAEALNLVNQVRTRNGHNPVDTLTALTAEELLAERGREFAWEGWRRNDQIRFNAWGNAWDYKPASDAKCKLFPIPQIQMDSNPNLIQNTGY